MKRCLFFPLGIGLVINFTVQAGTIDDIRERLGVKNTGGKGSSVQENRAVSDNRTKGSNIKIVTCYDNKHSYAVCLPDNYNENTKYPVLFCFDPGGDGITAVKNFTYAAEKYKWILVGSMDAKNGPWGVILRAQEVILKDVKERYRVDDKRFYAAGFSGGARMAYTMAYNNPRYFKAVIACGAGFGLGGINKHTAVYHCAGDEDFNIKEVKKAYDTLKKRKVRTKLNEFSGDHRWPPTYVRNEAVDWVVSLNGHPYYKCDEK